MQALTLSELNHMVGDLIALSLPDSFWVTAEIAEARQAANGHYYIELVEKAQHAAGSAFKAKARANLWRNTAAIVVPHFERKTGQRLQAGLKVMLEVNVAFHEVFGYSLTVLDIDPTYTLGDLAQQRQAILQQLDDEGVLTLNKELTLPHPLLRIAVVSAEGAAGYGDFCHQLAQSGHPFVTRLFPAIMQGEKVEASVIAALDRIAAQQEQWDAVAIIRGGGATSDLLGFDTYLLAANVAQFPLPIITGIGHERDDTVLDEIAHTRCKTPTAVAAFLIERHRNETQQLGQLAERLRQAVERHLHAHQQQLQSLTLRYQQSANNFVQHQLAYIQSLRNRTDRAVGSWLNQQELHHQQLAHRLRTAPHQWLEQQSHQLQRFETTLRMADPQRILSLGYSLTTDAQGRLVRSAQQLAEGQILRTRLADGEIKSKVINSPSTT